MSDPRLEEDNGSPIASAVIAGIAVFLFGTCLVQGVVALIVSVFSESLYWEMIGNSPANPNRLPTWSYWCVCAASAVPAILAAIVFARRTYRAAITKSEQLSTERPSESRLTQFTLRSLLLFQLYAAICLGLIAWLGRPIVPGVLGIVGSMVGYGATLVSARRRALDVGLGYVVGIVAGLFFTMASVPARPLSGPTLEDFALAEQARRWTVIAVLVTLPVVTIIATWRLRRRPR